MRTVETAQTFLTASEMDALVGDDLAGMIVKALAERYGSTVPLCSHNPAAAMCRAVDRGWGSTKRLKLCDSRE